MDCSTCNLEINNENYIICSCGNKYNQNMLFSYLDHNILHLNVIHVYIIIIIIHQ